MFETPEFRRYEETTNMELFYDLFFVANLTTFNDVHDVNEIDALKSYAGFFCILWFLWLQVSLFDVRFVTDSVLERIAKAFQFGVMIGLAIIGPDFNSSNQKPGAFRSVAIILMASRLVLSLQYSAILVNCSNILMRYVFANNYCSTTFGITRIPKRLFFLSLWQMSLLHSYISPLSCTYYLIQTPFHTNNL